MRITFHQDRSVMSIPCPPEGARELTAYGLACPCCAAHPELRELHLRGRNPEPGPGFGEVSADAACVICSRVVGRLRVSEDDGLMRFGARACLRVAAALSRLPFFEANRPMGA